MKAVKNPIIGQKVGRLTLCEIEESVASNHRVKKTAHCVCVCGAQVIIPLYELGNKKSCGCLRGDVAHGKAHTKVWAAWQKMKSRCYNKNCPKYPSYGGRGIFVCDGLKQFKNFYEIMGEPPSTTHSNDRIDNNKGYTCGKCSHCIKNGYTLNIHWATPKQQSQNQRTNHVVLFDGKKVCLVEACRMAAMPYKSVFARISNGWNFEKAITTPINENMSNKKNKNVTISAN